MTTIARGDGSGQTRVVVGVDTHRDTHTAAVIDTAGRLLGSAQFPADPAGFRALLGWVVAFGVVMLAAVEGTGSYGAGLARFLRAESIDLVEIDRPDRRVRRLRGKSDPVDAEAAARAGLSRSRLGVPKDRTGQIEALRVLRVARRSAVDQRADVIRRVKALVVTAPDELREQLRRMPTGALMRACAGFRPDAGRVGEPVQAVKYALRSLARRYLDLSAEIAELDAVIEPLIEAINPRLLGLVGVGTDVAGQLLVTVGDNPGRIRSEAAFAMICGVAPLPASSGNTNRHRLNRGGDRQANAALYRAAISRLRWDPRTQEYAARRTAEGLSKKDIIRCLKRLIAREIYYVITR